MWELKLSELFVGTDGQQGCDRGTRYCGNEGDSRNKHAVTGSINTQLLPRSSALALEKGKPRSMKSL